MSKRKYLKFGLELIFILLILMGELKILDKRKYLPVYDPDEIAWVFTGYYFNLYFLRFDLLHPDWDDYEAFDHPPLGKYIIGGALFLQGYTIDSLDAKRLINSIPINEFQTYLHLLTPKVPNPNIVIPSTRSVIFLFALSSLLYIYIFIRMSYGVLPAFISTLLIIGNPIFNYVSTRILADPILFFFLTLFILLCALFLKSQKTIYIFFAFVVSSFAFLTKLNGILLVFVLIALFLIKNRFSISRQDWKLLIMGIAAFLLIAILLNPVFLNTGFKAIWKMAEVRLSAFRVYQETFKGVALLSVSERFVTATKMIFFDYSMLYRLTKVPVELILFASGIYYIFRERDLLLILIFAFLIVIPISILPFNIPRYYYWISPFIYIIAGLSSLLFKEIFDKVDFHSLKARIDSLSK
jgi:hypothetical protein